MKTISRFFADSLGAPLRNPRWSWGAFDSTGSRLFLRVWDSEIERYANGERIVVALKTPRRPSLGFPERRRHVEALAKGAECYGVLCTPVEYSTDGPRTIKRFDANQLLRLGELSEKGNRVFAHIAERVRVEQVTTLGEARYLELADMEGLKSEVLLLKASRSRKLRVAALEAANGICSVCQEDFSKVLAGRGIRVLQVHHCQQLSARKTPSVTKLSDLAVVCANCHLLLHLNAQRPLSVAALREMLYARRQSLANPQRH